MPGSWAGFTIEYRHKSSMYTITVRRRDGGGGPDRDRVFLDGEEQPDGTIRLADDAKQHQVIVDMA